MGRRPVAGRDPKIAQGQRRDAFFAKLRRKGGVPPNQGPAAMPATMEEEGTPAELDLASDIEVAGAESEVAAEGEGKDVEAAAP